MLMKQEMMGGSGISWTGPYADHLHLAPTDNYPSTSSLIFLQVGCSSRCPSNTVKAPEAKR